MEMDKQKTQTAYKAAANKAGENESKGLGPSKNVIPSLFEITSSIPFPAITAPITIPKIRNITILPFSVEYLMSIGIIIDIIIINIARIHASVISVVERTYGVFCICKPAN